MLVICGNSSKITPKNHFRIGSRPLKNPLVGLKSPKLSTLSYACQNSDHLQCENGAHFLVRVAMYHHLQCRQKIQCLCTELKYGSGSVTSQH
jgi:hypothetical protein